MPPESPDRAETIPGRERDEALFLAELGDALRRARAARALSRKALATTAGISERYIAQAESGQGNVSVLILRRLANALSVPLANLVAPAPPGDPNRRALHRLIDAATPEQIQAARAALLGTTAAAPMAANAERVALIGLRGAGKSTLGRLAADRLGWTFVELNREIERAAGFSVAEIFSLYGTEGYRRLEQEALRGVAGRPGAMLLATGGGIVAEPATFELLRHGFRTIWIKASPEEHMARVRAQGDLRPMGNDPSAMTELRGILARREAHYARADAVVDTAGKDVGESVDALLAIVRGVAAASIGATA